MFRLKNEFKLDDFAILLHQKLKLGAENAHSRDLSADHGLHRSLVDRNFAAGPLDSKMRHVGLFDLFRPYDLRSFQIEKENSVMFFVDSSAILMIN